MGLSQMPSLSLKTLAVLLPLLASPIAAIDLDPKSQDSIKKVSSTLAAGLVAEYNKAYKEPGAAPGIFGDPYYWGPSGAYFNALISYSQLTGDNQYNELLAEALKHQLGKEANFLPGNQTKSIGNDDQATWALGALTAAEAGWADPVEGKSWLGIAATAFDDMTQRWDAETCDGGLHWMIFSFSSGWDYKNSASNGLYFQLAARLALATGNETYGELASKSLEWSKSVGLVDEEWHVFDGADASGNCSTVNKLQWSMNVGAYIEGAAALYNATEGDTWKTALTGFIGASSLVVDKNSGTLIEPACETNNKCNVEMRMFKGRTARNFYHATLLAPSLTSSLRDPLSKSAVAAAKTCNGADGTLECGFVLTGEKQGESTEARADEVFNALELVQGLLMDGEDVGKPAGNATQGGNGTHTGSPTESGAPESTGTAGRTGVAWGVVALAAGMAVFGLA